MRKIVFAVGVLTTSTSFCLGKSVAHQPEKLLTFQEWQKMNAALPSYNDFITLVDGTEINGTVERLPAIEYSFGRLDFAPHEVAAIIFSPALNKMQVITRQGHNFVGGFPGERIVFYETDSVTGKKIPKEFDPALIDFIVFKERGELKPVPHKRYYSLLFKNGDRIPVALASDSLQFSNGFEDFSVPSEEISSISFNDGFEGTRVSKDGIKRKIAGSCIKGDYLCVHLAKGQQEIHFPWKLIAALESNFQQTTSPYSLDEKTSTPRISEKQTPYRPEPLFSSNEEFDIPTDIDFDKDVASEILALVEDSLFDEEIESLEDTDIEEPEDDGAIDEVIPEEQEEQTDERGLPRGQEEETSEEELPRTHEQPTFEEELPRTHEQPTFEEELPRTHEQPTFEEELPRTHEQPTFEEELPRTHEQPTFKDELSKVRKNAKAQEEEELAAAIIQEMLEQSNSAYVALEEAFSETEEEVLLEPQEEAPSEEVVFASSGNLSPRKVTNGEYQNFLEATYYLPPSHWEHGKVPQGQEDEPVVNVSYNDALMYTLWAGKRLPTEEELHQADLEDRDDGIGEWTASVTINDPKDYSKPKHRIVGQKPAALENAQCSNEVGFRCAE